jgi:hypothetical protein
MEKTPRDIIGDENVMTLTRAGFVVVRRSELAKLRALIKLGLDALPSPATRKFDRG